MILPIGIEDFEELIKKKLDFVDKTLFIKEILDDRGTKVVVIMRPRCFGKTLNLSMLHYFLAEQVYGRSTKHLFDHLNIAHPGDEYMKHQGKYPVVFITLKDIKDTNYAAALKKLSLLMSRLYHLHKNLLDSTKLTSSQKNKFISIMDESADESLLQSSLLELTYYLYLHYGIKPWLLIDEYDTPLQSGYMSGYYEDIIVFMRGMFGSALKTNPYIEKAVITGILCIVKESLFSDVNNLEVYSILKNEYSQYFGFIESEVDELLNKANFSEKAKEIKEWYNGYQIGNTVIYNPWSIVNCLKQKGELVPYWVNTGGNQLIKELLKKSSIEFKADFEDLIQGKYVEKLIDENMVFQYLSNNPSSVWSLLLMSGYLKSTAIRQTSQGTFAQLTIPNKEVKNLYRQIVEQWLSNGHGIEWYNRFIEALITGKIEEFKNYLNSVIEQIASYHDFAKEPEIFYQGLMLGFTVSLHFTGSHEIKSNRESGLGRFDIMLIPKDTGKLGIIIELKVCAEKENRLKIAKKAVKQIDQLKYAAEFKQRSINHIIKIGIGFCGKAFELYAVGEDL